MIDIKNCWERLQPFIKESLEKEKDKYPHTYKDTKAELEANVSVQQLTFGTLTTVMTYSNGKYGGSILDFYSMFED